MALLVWSSVYEIGVEAIDNQHKHMIELSNRLYEALTELRGEAALAALFDELREHVAVHFASEEEYMASIGYPHLEEQRQQHEELERRTLELAEAHRQGRRHLSPEVMHFLRDWITEHLLHYDRRIGEYVREQGLGR